MVTHKSGIILDQNDDGPLKWANGPYPIQIHADYIILMGFLNFYGPFAKFDGLIYEAQLKITSILAESIVF